MHAYSCKSRWFCPACHQKNVQTTAAFLTTRVLAPVPHRHYVLAIPKMLRPYFQRHRTLLKCLCALAYQSLAEYLRAAVSPSPPSEAGGRRDSFHPAIILTLHTFGEYLDFHPHVHALVALKLLPPERVQVLHSWKHSVLNVHCCESIPPKKQCRTRKTRPVHPAQSLLRGKDDDGIPH